MVPSDTEREARDTRVPPTFFVPEIACQGKGETDLLRWAADWETSTFETATMLRVPAAPQDPGDVQIVEAVNLQFDAVLVDALRPEQPVRGAAPKGRRGPRPLFDWPAALTEVRRVEVSEGLPVGQGSDAAVIEVIQEFFARTFDREPSATAVRNWLRREGLTWAQRQQKLFE
jgi:hypothetical protein